MTITVSLPAREGEGITDIEAAIADGLVEIEDAVADGVILIQATEGSGGGGSSLDPSGLLHIFAGDSTTWQGQANGGMGDAFAQLDDANGMLEGSAGFLNLGASGWTLSGFVTGGATPGFVGPVAGDTYWNYAFVKNGGSPDRAPILVTLADCVTLLGTLADTQRVALTICFGINDLILYPATGNLTQTQIETYIQGYLRTAVETLRAAHSRLTVILRCPNPMIARPALSYVTAQYPTFDSDLPYAAALILKFNTALRNAYRKVAGEYAYAVFWDCYETTFGEPNTTTATTTNYPALQDMVHPSVSSYYNMGRDYAGLIAGPPGAVPYGRLKLADLLATTNSTYATEEYDRYCEGHPEKYTLAAQGLIGAVGSNYMDIGTSIGDFNVGVAGRLPIFVEIENLATQRFAGYTAGASGANTRLVSITVNATMQTAAAALPVRVWVEKSVASNDTYLDPLQFNYGSYRKSYRASVLAGNGYVDLYFYSVDGMFRIDALRTLTGLSLAIGGSVDATIDLGSGWSIGSWTPGALHMRILKSGNWSSYNDNPGLLLVNQSAVDPKAREAPYIVTAANRLSELYAMGLVAGYQPGATTITVSTGIAVASGVTVEAFVFASNVRTSLGSVTISANAINGTITHSSRNWTPGEALELVVTSPGSYAGTALVSGVCA